ncbi:MAG: hypothetical protein AB1468_05705 [Candidatus Micrarchaeota archaeon]
MLERNANVKTIPAEGLPDAVASVLLNPCIYPTGDMKTGIWQMKQAMLRLYHVGPRYGGC